MNKLPLSCAGSDIGSYGIWDLSIAWIFHPGLHRCMGLAFWTRNTLHRQLFWYNIGQNIRKNSSEPIKSGIFNPLNVQFITRFSHLSMISRIATIQSVCKHYPIHLPPNREMYSSLNRLKLEVASSVKQTFSKTINARLTR